MSRFPDDGVISVSVEAEPQAPLVLTGFDWAEAGVLTYALRWYPVHEDAAAGDSGQAGRDTADYLTQRDQARVLIERCALALLKAVGGQVADDDGFLVAL